MHDETLLFLLNGPARAVENVSGASSCVLAVFDDNLTVYQNVVDTGRRSEGIFVGRVILNLVVIEDDDIGPVTFFD